MSETRPLLKKEIVYDGEEYSREKLETVMQEYQVRHKADLTRLEEFRKLHDDIADEMSKDLVESRSAWDYLKDMVASRSVARLSTNFRGLLEKIPILNDYIADRPISELLQEKISVAEKRTKEMGNFLDKIESEIQNLRNDITRLNKKMIVAAQNEEKAAAYILELREYEKKLEAEIETMTDRKSVSFREKTAEVDDVKAKIWEHGGKLRLYSNAEDRITGIIKMNNNFLEILLNLHGNMQNLYDAALEVLDELRGNLTGLVAVTEASDITLQMNDAMKSLKVSVNKIATLASNTSLYLTQNVERLTSEMKMYDDATQALIKSNLAAEREIKEKRIDETIELARKEYSLAVEAREREASTPPQQ
jgi:hypothetical protein